MPASGPRGPFDAVVASMVLLDIPDWTGAEPALDHATAATAGNGADAYAHLPNFLVVVAQRATMG